MKGLHGRDPEAELKHFFFIRNKQTLHLAAQLLDGLGCGLVIVWQLLPGGDRVGAGPVRQAALRGTLVPGALLLPVQVVLHQELQLFRWRRTREVHKYQRFHLTFEGFKWEERTAKECGERWEEWSEEEDGSPRGTRGERTRTGRVV